MVQRHQHQIYFITFKSKTYLKQNQAEIIVSKQKVCNLIFWVEQPSYYWFYRPEFDADRLKLPRDHSAKGEFFGIS